MTLNVPEIRHQYVTLTCLGQNLKWDFSIVLSISWNFGWKSVNSNSVRPNTLSEGMGRHMNGCTMQIFPVYSYKNYKYKIFLMLIAVLQRSVHMFSDFLKWGWGRRGQDFVGVERIQHFIPWSTCKPGLELSTTTFKSIITSTNTDNSILCR